MAEDDSNPPVSDAVAELRTSVIELRIEGIKDAVSRSRLAFLVTTTISLMMILGIWNSYFSWDREFAFLDEWPKKGVERGEVIEHLQKGWLDHWLNNQQISVPLLGISVSTSDATFLASVALVVAVIWFFWSTRRENHSIAQLLDDTLDESVELKRLVYHGISVNLVFIYLSDDDSARGSLREKSEVRPFRLMRFLVRGLSYLPTFALFFCGSVQLIYVFEQSPLRVGKSYPGHIFYIAFVSVVAVVALVTTLMVAHRVSLFQDGIKNMIKEYARSIPGLQPSRPEGRKKTQEKV